jgi:hypothetical protein
MSNFMFGFSQKRFLSQSSIQIRLSRTAFMSSVQTGGSTHCESCNAAYHKLSSHLSWNARCAAFYDSLLPDMVNGVVDDVHRPDVAYFHKEGGDTTGAGESRKSSKDASTFDQPIDDYNDEGFDEDFSMMSPGDVSVCSSSEESEDEGKDKEIPDGII